MHDGLDCMVKHRVKLHVEVQYLVLVDHVSVHGDYCITFVNKPVQKITFFLCLIRLLIVICFFLLMHKYKWYSYNQSALLLLLASIEPLNLIQ